MKLSTRCRYGLKAIINIAKHYKSGTIKRSDIALQIGISSAYLENILISLKNYGLIKTVRGSNGGYIMEKPPECITMYDIIFALDGSFAPVCVENAEGCGQKKHCPAHSFWISFNQMQMTLLKSTTLQNIIEKGNNLIGEDYDI
jgi:Rrf2 family protein